jgi:SAM-dependent methyltransferase
MVDKHHWYDGAFYDRCIAPNQDRLFSVIRALVRPGERVLDVGCGTGRLVLQLAHLCGEVVGVDPSLRNIRRAELVRARRGHPPNVRFRHGTARDADGVYDAAVISFVLHEVDAAARAALLAEVRGVARRIILADYRVPRVPGIMDTATEIVEFLAGREHYRGFRSFVRRGGLAGLLAEAGVRVAQRIEGAPLPGEILVVEGAGAASTAPGSGGRAQVRAVP